jgi:hypothetical protein
MTDIRTLLQEADPLGEPLAPTEALTPNAAQAIRHAVLVAARDAAPAVPLWRRPLAFAAVAAALTVITGIVGHRSGASTVDSPPAVADGAAGEVDCRQLQFATPGGTRIIWIFDDNVRFQESMP